MYWSGELRMDWLDGIGMASKGRNRRGWRGQYWHGGVDNDAAGKASIGMVQRALARNDAAGVAAHDESGKVAAETAWRVMETKDMKWPQWNGKTRYAMKRRGLTGMD
jgi:hypothetical protein